MHENLKSEKILNFFNVVLNSCIELSPSSFTLYMFYPGNNSQQCMLILKKLLFIIQFSEPKLKCPVSMIPYGIC